MKLKNIAAWDWIMNILLPAKEDPVKSAPMLIVDRKTDGFQMELIRDGVSVKGFGIDYLNTYDRLLVELEEDENAAKV